MKLLITLLFACCAISAQGQSFCSSDGQPTPMALVERFFSADCEDCWSAPDAQQGVPDAKALVLDWIVPGQKGDDAPLGGATRDALTRLEMQRMATPRSLAMQSHRVSAGSDKHLRVAHGLPVANYIGASIELTPASGGPWTAVLLLVEHIPAGTEGTPIPRNLVRNMLVTAWNGPHALSLSEQLRFFESRPMSLPEGTRVARLRAVGWVLDAQGGLVALAQSECQAAPAD